MEFGALFSILFFLAWVGFVLLFISLFALWIMALVEVVELPNDSFFRSGSKTTWILVVALLQLLGAIIYLAVARPAKEVRDWAKAMRRQGWDLSWTQGPYQALPVPHGPAPPGPPSAGAPYGPPPAPPPTS